MPNVAQVSKPKSLTPLIMATTFSMSRSFGSRQAAPIQKRFDPASLAAFAAAKTSSTSINLVALTSV